MTPATRRWLRHAVQGAWDGLDFAIELPEDWALQGLDGNVPAEPADFVREPARLFALLEARSPDGACSFQVAARPSEMASALVTNAVYLLGQRDVDLDDDFDERVGAYTGLAGGGWRPTAGGGRERLQWAVLEDGGRLLLCLLAGPAAQPAALAALWTRLAGSFRLLAPRGQRQPLLTPPRPRRDADAGPPAWWRDAQALQSAGRIEAAIALVARECAQAGALLAQAELMARQRTLCLQADDLAGARAAHRAAAGFARAYAAGATSGSEGAALSLECERFIAGLGPPP